MGSNMAENHPVGFQWVLEAKLKGAPVMHVDPRFTRTSANATLHVPIRAGSDIAFLGGIVNHILQTDAWFRDYVVPYTNAANLVSPDFQDSEDLDGLFSGFDPATRAYDTRTWQYEGVEGATGPHGGAETTARTESSGGLGGSPGTRKPIRDETLQHPRTVFQVLKRHFARYTPALVEQVTGVRGEQFLQVAETLCANSGRERTSAIVYSVGWTQHTVGVQLIRTAAIIQLLLGNMGRPGGGVMALRGHAGIQGSTDIPTLFDLLPGYIPMPQVQSVDLDTHLASHPAAGGGWANLRAYLVSLLKAYWGDAASAANDFGFGFLPRIDADHGTYRTTIAMLDGKVRGYFLPGENPAVGSANGKLQRHALAKLDWLVVRDLFLTESATFWLDSPEVRDGELSTESIGTEVFFLPAAAHTEKQGSFTNTQRLLQWHHAAVEPASDCRSDLWFYFHLGRVIRAKLAGSTEPRDASILALAWDYPVSGPTDEPDAEAVLREIGGLDALGRPLEGFSQLRDDGSTRCGCWIYSGVFAGGVNQAARRLPGAAQNWVAPDWGWAWPANRRLLYNRASADPAGRPWSERKKYLWWDSEAARWIGFDVPDFDPVKSPGYVPAAESSGDAALRGDAPFIMQGDGLGWLYAPTGIRDGPLPTHYEPRESPVHNSLHGQDENPLRETFEHPLNRYNDDPGRYPFVMTSYRLTEHHTAGAMSRNIGVLSELQPAFFCEVSPALAALRGLTNGGFASISTARGSIRARVMVTERMAPLEIEGGTIHQVGLPFHWGTRGLTVGDSANDAFALALDPNVHIQEVKAATCDIRPAAGDAVARP